MPFADHERGFGRMSDRRQGRQAPTLYVTATDPSIDIAGLSETARGGRG